MIIRYEKGVNFDVSGKVWRAFDTNKFNKNFIIAAVNRLHVV